MIMKYKPLLILLACYSASAVLTGSDSSSVSAPTTGVPRFHLVEGTDPAVKWGEPGRRTMFRIDSFTGKTWYFSKSLVVGSKNEDFDELVEDWNEITEGASGGKKTISR
jgi:hypothetical protein